MSETYSNRLPTSCVRCGSGALRFRGRHGGIGFAVFGHCVECDLSLGPWFGGDVTGNLIVFSTDVGFHPGSQDAPSLMNELFDRQDDLVESVAA